MQQKLKLAFSLLLPHVESEQDQCLERLIELLRTRKGIEEAHVDRSDTAPRLCLHYDANLVSMPMVRRWAERAGAEITDRYCHETLRLTGMDCGDCAASIEHLLARLPGVVAVSVSYASERIRIEYDTTVTNHDKVVRRVHWMGYKIEEEVRKTWVAHNVELLMALLCGALLLAGLLCHLLPGWPARLPVAFYLLSYLAGGYHAAHHALKAALKFRFDVDSLMVIAALGAAALGEWPEGALLLFLFSLGHALEHYAMNRARRAIEALGQITPQTSRVRRDGEEVEVSVERLQRNDMVIVRPGERLPIDGVIVQGRSAIDQSTLTGESVPVEKGVGDEVLAGTLNGAAALEVRVTKLAADTMLARVIQLVAEAQTQKSPTQRFAERFEGVFVPVVLLCVVAVIVVPPVAGWLSWSDAFLRAMTMLVAASPCALAIATPSAILAGIAQAARHGVLIKGGVHLEVLGTIDAMAFDKTGTLTCGVPEVTDVVVWEATRDELLALAAAAESRSEHPLARAVVTAAQREGLTLAEVQDVTSIVGLGVAARVGGQVVRVGAVDLFDVPQGAPLPEEKMAAVEQLQREGKTIVLVERGSHLLGLIGLADRPRPDAQPTMQALMRLGIRSLVMLTGDHERVAAVMAAEVGIGQYRAGLMPEDKVAAIRQLREEYGEVVMVGDGVNDAPALATASVGIAMGASGSDVALETADVALMSDDLSRLPFTVALSRQTRRIIRQNLVIALGVILALIPVSVLGLTGIGVAIVFHEGSTLLVVANALRLLRFETSTSISKDDRGFGSSSINRKGVC